MLLDIWGSWDTIGTLADVADVDNKILRFCEAHRKALREGDERLDKADRAILLAVVARSAVDTVSWIRTRVPDGDRRCLLLKPLADELQKQDTLGKGLLAVERDLFSQAKKLARAAVGLATTPVWVASVVTVVVGFGGFLLNVGSVVGGEIVYGIFAVAALMLIFPPLRLPLMGAIAGSTRSFAGFGKSVSATTTTILRYPSSVGSSAESVFSAAVTSEGDALRGSGYVARESRAVLTPLRSTASLVIAVAFIALAFSAVFFILGVKHGFLQQAKYCQTHTAPNSDCGTINQGSG